MNLGRGQLLEGDLEQLSKLVGVLPTGPKVDQWAGVAMGKNSQPKWTARRDWRTLMRHHPRSIWLIPVAVATTTCCSGGGSGADHGSPTAAVVGYIHAFKSGKAAQLLSWTPPDERGQLQAQVDQIPNGKYTVHVRTFRVVKTVSEGPQTARVYVRLGGQVCFAGCVALEQAPQYFEARRVQGEWFVANNVGFTAGP